MGTRADFYLGKGKNSIWMGSVGYDGYLSGIPKEVLNALSEREYLNQLGKFLAGKDHATIPSQGWPWSWHKTSEGTDCVYAFFQGRVWGVCDIFGSECWVPVSKKFQDVEYPDMSGYPLRTR
jgi:hypothetical protein